MIWIFGDSFSTNKTVSSWTRQLKDGTQINSLNGVSEYRILRQIKKFSKDIKPNDVVIICHTNPHRVYIPDRIPYPARKESSHPQCDLVISDSMNRNLAWRLISKIYFKYFFDEDYSTQVFDLIISEEKSIVQSRTNKLIEVSGFEGQPNSFYDTYISHVGKINHMSKEGNQIVADRVKELINAKIY